MENGETVKFGRMYQDKVSGFIGQCTGRAEYIEGDQSVRLEAVDNTGRPVEYWVNVNRIEEYIGEDLWL